MNKGDDIREARYKIITSRRETHEWAGARALQYMYAVHEAQGDFVQQAQIEAETAMRSAYLDHGQTVKFCDEFTIQWIDCGHREQKEYCENCLKTQGLLAGSAES